MKLVVDVHYEGEGATVAGILFPSWSSDAVCRALTRTQPRVEPYEPGAFYKRELPCLLALLERIDDPLDAVVVDGFVTLGDRGVAGLGMHLFQAMGGFVPVIGVAKRRYAGTPIACEVFRGGSRAPLFVTAAGIGHGEAKELVQGMHGLHRIPTLLGKVDRLCRGIAV